MRTIEVDEDVFRELERRVQGFNETPNDVMRRVLALYGATGSGEGLPGPDPPARSPLIEMVATHDYKMLPTAVDKYLYILFWLHTRHPDDFPKIERYGSGKRVYFSKDAKKILSSGQGVTAKRIPKSPYSALVTLDNARKRMIITDIITSFGYPVSEASAVAGTIEDSGRRRGRSRYSAEVLAEAAESC